MRPITALFLLRLHTLRALGRMPPFETREEKIACVFPRIHNWHDRRPRP